MKRPEGEQRAVVSFHLDKWKECFICVLKSCAYVGGGASQIFFRLSQCSTKVKNHAITAWLQHQTSLRFCRYMVYCCFSMTIFTNTWGSKPKHILFWLWEPSFDTLNSIFIPLLIQKCSLVIWPRKCFSSQQQQAQILNIALSSVPKFFSLSSA